jgi:hypothetical protein
VLPSQGGLHHYPAPVTEIEFFKYDDFQLWVTDEQGRAAAVAPVGRRGSGDGRTRVLAAEPGSELHEKTKSAWRKGRTVVLPPAHRASEEAFGEQYAKIATGSVDPDDPLVKASLPGA